jgi:ABC-2 type transport system ATP-binding protein
MYAIETNHLKKFYQTGSKKPVLALADLNLQVATGQIFGFIGPNGAGKTTTIKIITGLLYPTSGTAKIYNLPAGSIPAMRKIGYLSEIAYYYNFIEAEKLLYFYGTLKNMSRKELIFKIKEVLALVGLQEKAKVCLREFSKGMQERFGIALAILGSPDILILDEPTSGLDPIAQKEVKDIILNLKARGLTIFLSSHQLSDIERICDTVCIINKGKVLTITPMQLFLQGDKATLNLRCQSLDAQLENALKDQPIAWQKAGEYLILQAREAELSSIIDFVHSKGGQVVEVSHEKMGLEEAFYKLIKEGA